MQGQMGLALAIRVPFRLFHGQPVEILVRSAEPGRIVGRYYYHSAVGISGCSLGSDVTVLGREIVTSLYILWGEPHFGGINYGGDFFLMG